MADPCLKWTVKGQEHRLVEEKALEVAGMAVEVVMDMVETVVSMVEDTGETKAWGIEEMAMKAEQPGGRG